MTFDQINVWLKRSPFQPFEVVLNDSDSHEVKSRENLILLKSRLVIGRPATDRMISIYLSDIETIQLIKQSQKAKISSQAG